MLLLFYITHHDNFINSKHDKSTINNDVGKVSNGCVRALASCTRLYTSALRLASRVAQTAVLSPT